jgi:hypothetical protein
MDDEFTLSHEHEKEFLLKSFLFKKNQLNCSFDQKILKNLYAKNEKIENNKNYFPVNTVEKIEITNQKKNPTKVVLSYKNIENNNNNNNNKQINSVDTKDVFVEENLKFILNFKNNVLTIKNPNVKIAHDWVITLVF